jgi:hypothetical protein
MKPPLVAVLILAASGGAYGQNQSISTYGSGIGLGTVTTIQPTGNGYTYSTIGGPNGGSWGGVIASPGTSVQAAVSPRGNVLPIVSAAQAPVVAPTPDTSLVPAEIADAKAQELTAYAHLLESLPAAPHPEVNRVARGIRVDRSNEVNAEFVSLFGRLGSQERRYQFWRDFQTDFPKASFTNFPTRESLPYLKLWLRDHEITPSQ